MLPYVTIYRRSVQSLIERDREIRRLADVIAMLTFHAPETATRMELCALAKQYIELRETLTNYNKGVGRVEALSSNFEKCE